MTPHRDCLRFRAPNPNGPFMAKRVFPSRPQMPGWIYYNYPRDLREATALPVPLTRELKPGFYLPDPLH